MKDKKSPLLEVFENLSGWVKGIIALLTALVSFVFIFRDNIELMVILIVITTSIFAMIAAWYILTAKTAPLIEGGKGVYTYPKLRMIAKLILILIPISNFMFFSSSYGKDALLITVYGKPTETQAVYVAPPTSINTSIDEQSSSLTQTPKASPLESINIEFKSIVCGSRLILPENLFSVEEAFAGAQKYYTATASGFTFDTFDVFYLGTPPVLIKITNQQPTDGSWVQIDNKIKVEVESVATLKHVDVGTFSWGKGVSGGYIGFGCGGGGGNSFIFPEIELDNQTKTFVSENQDYDYFSIEPGEFFQFEPHITCAAPGVYKYHLIMNMSYADEERQYKSSPYYAFCPESYTEWWFHDVVNDGDIYNVHTINNAGTFSPTASWDYLLTEPGWVITKPWKPCPTAPDSLMFPDPNSKRPIINPEEKNMVNVRSEPSISAEITEQLPPGYMNLKTIEGPVCADNYVWWKVEIHVFSNETTPVTSGWIAEGDETEKWLIVKREIPNHILISPQP